MPTTTASGMALGRAKQERHNMFTQTYTRITEICCIRSEQSWTQRLHRACRRASPLASRNLGEPSQARAMLVHAPTGQDIEFEGDAHAKP